MMKKILFVLLVLGFMQSVKSQEIARNNFYLELGGAAMMYSVNYERLLSTTRDFNFPVRIGLSYTNTNVFDGNNTLGIPVSISFIKHLSKNLYFEIKAFVTAFFYKEKYYGMGGSMYVASESFVKYMPGLSAGLRGQPSTAGLYYHIHIQAQYIEGEIGPFLSLGLGYAF